MHTRSRTWPLNSDPVQRCRDRTGLIDSPDGSTLSLDFTTGVLDPRLNFTRGTNATFINSQGLVQWANSNMFRNTVWTSTSLPTGWLANPSNTGTITYNGDGTISCNASSQTAWIYPNFPYVETANGLSYICSVRVVSISAPAPVNAIVSSGNLTALEYFIDGVSKLASDSVTGPCVVSVRVTASGTQWYPRLGAGVQGVNVSFNLVMSEPHAHPGVAPRAYMANTSTSAANFNTPRFDYDPTAIGTPLGLLIEGSAINYMLESTSLSGYSNSNMVAITSGTETDPEGNANSAKQIYASATTGYHGWYRNVTAGTNTTVTVSIWAKARDYTFLFLSDAASGRAAVRFNLQTGATDNNFGAGYVSAKATPYTNGWWRCEMTVSVTASTGYGWTFVGLPTSGATLNAYGAQYNGTGNAADGIYCYGFQVEGGSGASSYIPTGASQGNRAADVCTIGVDAGTATNFSSWWPLNQSQFTVAWTGDLVRNTSAVQFLWLTRNSVNTSVMRVFANSTSGQPLFGFAGNSIPTSVAVNGIPGATLKTALAAQEGDQAFYANNGTVSSSGVAANTGLAFTSVSMNFNPNADQFMHIKSFKFWPTRLPNAQLQALTT